MNLELEAIINTRPAASEMVSLIAGDPDPGGDMDILVTDHTDILGNYNTSALIKLYRDRKIRSTVTLYYYKDDPDIVGNPYDTDILDWETAASSAVRDYNDTPSYTWNVNSLIDIKTKNYGVETEDYIAVWVEPAISVRKHTSGSETTPASGVTIRAKIYDDGGDVEDYTLTTDSEGKAFPSSSFFKLSKGEYITLSVFLKDHPETYNSQILPYSTAEAGAEKPQQGSHKVYTWKAALTLYAQ